MMTNPIQNIEYPGNCQGFFGFPTEVFYYLVAEDILSFASSYFILRGYMVMAAFTNIY